MTYLTATITQHGRHWFVIGEVTFLGSRTTETITRRCASRAAAEREAEGFDAILIAQAENYRDRIDAARAYLAGRCARTSKVEDDAQLSLL